MCISRICLKTHSLHNFETSFLNKQCEALDNPHSLRADVVLYGTMFLNFILVSALLTQVHADERSALFSKLFANYDPSIRPKQDASYVTNVTVYLSLFSVLSVNEQMQTIRFTVDMAVEWTDPLLTWPATDGGINELKIPEQSIWTPDIMLFSAISKQHLIDYNRRVVVLKNNGSIVKAGPQIVTHPCRINVQKFPYDDQICTFLLSSWSFSNANLRLHTPYDEYELNQDFTGNTEWKLLSLTCELFVDTTYDEGDYDTLIVTAHIRRHPQFYVLAIIIPSFVCTFLCLNGLFLPSEISGLSIEKVSLGVCTLLAMALILQSVTVTMPKSQDLPLLGVYVLSQTILCGIAVLVTSIYLIIHERAVTRSWTPPRCIANAFLTREYDRKVTHNDGSQQDGQKSTRLSPYFWFISSFLLERASDSRLERMWARIFDRIDVFTLVVFQVANVIMTMVILL